LTQFDLFNKYSESSWFKPSDLSCVAISRWIALNAQSAPPARHASSVTNVDAAVRGAADEVARIQAAEANARAALTEVANI